MAGQRAIQAQVLGAWFLMLVCCASVLNARPVTFRGVNEALHSSASRRLLQESPPTEDKTAEDGFEAAPSCRALPTAATSTADSEGRLWGWGRNASCAFKDAANHVLFYVGHVPREWLHTPACKAEPFPDSSVADSRFKVWGWENGLLCAFKDDHQQPIPIDRQYNKLSWADAPACVNEPQPSANNSAADNSGCLWGWQFDRNCAYKNATSSEPLYFEGYNQTCNNTKDTGSDFAVIASVAEGEEIPVDTITPSTDYVVPVDSAAAAAAGDNSSLPAVDLIVAPSSNASTNTSDEDVMDMPAVVTAIEPVGNKQRPAYYSADEVADKFANNELVSISEMEEWPTNKDAPFYNNTNTTTAPTSRRLLQDGVTNKEPKVSILKNDEWETPGGQERPSDWTDGGPGGIAPPQHGSRSSLAASPLLPETPRVIFAAAEGDTVVHKPVNDIPEPLANWLRQGPGGVSPPGTRGTNGRPIRLAAGELYGISEIGARQAPNSPSHVLAQAAPIPQRRRLSAANLPVTSATPVTSAALPTPTASGPLSLLPRKLMRQLHSPSAGVTSTASAISTGGTAVAQSIAAGASTLNSTAAATSNATSSGNGTALSIGVAIPTAAPNSSAVADSSAHANDGQSAVSIVNATVASANISSPSKCVLSAVSVNNITYVACPDQQNITAGHVYNVWMSAPVCKATPDKANSVTDTMNRLWGWEEHAGSCAFRAANGSSLTYKGFVRVPPWETVAACVEKPNTNNSMPDQQGRLWGFTVRGDNCAFKDEAGNAVYYPSYFKDSNETRSEAEPAQNAYLPAAAGPVKHDAAPTIPPAQPAPANLSSLPEAASKLVQAAEAQVFSISEALPEDSSPAEKALAAARQAVIMQSAAEAVQQATDHYDVLSRAVRAKQGLQT